MSLSDLVAWSAVAAVPLGAGTGWVLRRWGPGRFVSRMRPHYVLGYTALAIAALHVTLVIGSMQAANAEGLWFATFAFGALGVQTFLGASLQSPGVYRAPLRRWHMLLFWTIGVLILGHIVFD